MFTFRSCRPAGRALARHGHTEQPRRRRVPRKRQEAHRPYFHGLRLWLLHHALVIGGHGCARSETRRGARGIGTRERIGASSVASRNASRVR